MSGILTFELEHGGERTEHSLSSSNDLLGDCPHCQQPVALVPVSLFRFIVRCNNRKCSVRPRTWKMATPHDARAAWRQYLKTKIHPNLSSLRRPPTSRSETDGRERPEGVSAGVVVKSPNDKVSHREQ